MSFIHQTSECFSYPSTFKDRTKSLLEHDLADGTFISAKDKDVVIVGGGDTGNDSGV